MTAHPIPGSDRSRRLLTLLLGVALAGCGSTNPTAPPSPSPSAIAATASPVATASPTASPSPTVAATPEPTPASPSASTTANGWSAVADQASVANTQLTDVVWNGTRFVAIGIDSAGDGAFLESTDGLTWNQQTTAKGGHLADLATGPNGIVAVGSLNNRPGSWFSADGVTWKFGSGRFQLPSLGTDDVEVTSAVATDDGWLAVGRRDAACSIDCGLGPLRAIVWTSHDGLTWARVADQASFAKAGMTGVTRLGSKYVAVGLAVKRAVVWTSPDGSTWTRVPDAPMFHPRTNGPEATIEMTGVSAGHGVVVAIGMDSATFCQDVCGRSVRAWWSTDGRTWTKGTGQRFLNGQAFSVNATPSGFLAAGPSGADSCLGGIWASSDGKAWTCVASDPAFEGFGAYAAAGSPATEVVVGLGNGSEPTDAGEPGVIWWRPVR
jgi:hypothetical protein